MFKRLFDRDRIYLYPWYLAEECLTKDIEKIFDKKIDKTLLEFKKGHLYSYVNINQFNEIGEFLLEKVKNDKHFYSLVEKNILKTGEDLMEFCKKLITLKLDSLSNKELAEIYETYAKKLKIMRAWGWVPPLIDGVEIFFLSDYVQERLRVFLKDIKKEDKLAEYYSILSSSEKKSEVKTEEVERLELIKKIKLIDKILINLLKEKDTNDLTEELKNKYSLVFDLIKNHAKKFAWLTYAYIGPVMNEKDVINLIKDSLKINIDPEQQIKEINNHYKNLIKEKKDIIKKLELPDELKYLLDISSFFMYLKDLRKGIYQKSYVIMDLVLQEIANRIDLTMEEVKYLNRDEINNALIKKNNFKKIAFERTKYCVAITKNGETKVYQGKKAEDIIKKETFNEEIDKSMQEFKGSIAYSGKVRGIVKIISVVKDIPKMKEEEILVSPSTNPDLIMAMRKASAFITDMGGITSHAAIVSREMKKPCIVGTKIATKLLKDGDEVEVDAEKGIVKILKKV